MSTKKPVMGRGLEALLGQISRKPESPAPGGPAAAAAPQGVLAPRVVDEDVPHGARRRREEVLPALPGLPLAIGDPQIRLVDERGRLERVAGRQPSEKSAGDVAQLGVEELDELVARRGLPAGCRFNRRADGLRLRSSSPAARS